MAAPPVELPADSTETRTVKPSTASERVSPGTTGSPPIARPPRRYGWMFWLIVLALSGAGWHYRAQLEPYLAPVLTVLSPPKPAKPPVRSLTVGSAKVSQRDVNFYLNGLGTVTAFKTVTVRSRVEGELINVAMQEGQPVREGDVLAEIDPRLWEAQREQALAQLARDQAAQQSAQLTLARYKELLASKFATAQQVDEQLSLVQQSEAAIKSDRAIIANADLQLSYCRITAPISGRLGLRLVDAGNIVRANDPTGIAVITQLQPIALIFTIPQDDISRVQRRIREVGELTVEAFDRDFQHSLATGKLVALDNQVDSTTGTVRLKAVFENKDESLFPNQFVNARLLVETQRNATVAPTASVQRGPNGPFVYVLQEDETVAVREVKIGETEGTDTVILDGLTLGETVVTDGLDKLQPGAKVVTKDKKKAADSGNSPGKGSGGKQDAEPTAPSAKNSPPAESKASP